MKWDYVIIGTGMGGGPLGLQLAKAGFSVLFLEKGRNPKNDDAIRGTFAEVMPQQETSPPVYARAGRFDRWITDVRKGRSSRVRPFLGQGVGGSSALYGTVLERFREEDFAAWPMTYDELAPYYERAETLFAVRKNHRYQHPANEALHDFLKDRGLHPYPLPLANDDHPACGNCQSVLCPFNCKHDSGKVCVDVAVKDHGAQLIADCTVERIEMRGAVATGVQALHFGNAKFFEAERVIVAGGALASPLLLLSSVSEAFPQGLGNHAGLVGRYLMRHLVDLYALKVDRHPENPHAKEIGFNDYYNVDGEKLGTVQSFGRLPPTEVILQQLEADLPTIPRAGFRLVKPLLRRIIRHKTKNTLVMASIVEDRPSYENRIWQEGDRWMMHYELSKEDRVKIRKLRARLKKLFTPLGLWELPNSEKNEMLAHACGTCRMGDDANESVVDVHNRVHGTENLYVVDASFFPTSGGTNPALTIAANSLRVADVLLKNSLRGLP